ncbi:MAG: PPC domain-containing protein [Planctomycetes bacterium]|nr:PPC domain-containing protein [Planctomycetota bacterium]
MNSTSRGTTLRRFLAFAFLSICIDSTANAELPNPVLNAVFPAGGQAGTSVTVVLEGTSLESLRDIRSTIPDLAVKKLEGNRFKIDIPSGTPTGVYDLRGISLYGIGSPRAFFVSNRTEHLEKEPNDDADAAQEFPLDIVINGRIEKPGDIDSYKFQAKAGQRVVLECFAERIDSKLRGVLEVSDAAGKRLAVNRGYAGLDPLIDFLVPADGTYFVKLFDLSYLGSPAHFYRLDIDTKPRVEFALPCVVERGKTTKVKLFGRNLTSKQDASLDSVEVEITPPAADRHEPLPFNLRPAQIAVDAFAYHYPGSHAPVMIGVTNVPVANGTGNNLDAEHAQEMQLPGEVSGQLADGDKRHWYAVTARRGEVLWFEAFGDRLGSPVDLDLVVQDHSGKKELLKLSDNLENLGGYRFPTAHTDPAGRWVVPADGRYLIMIRNLIGGSNRDPRRIYRLSARREEPDFHLAVISRRTDQPAGLNLWAGGHEMLEVLAIRRRGMSGPIRISAEKLPTGVSCPEVWIGPGQNRGVVVLSAIRQAPSFAGNLNLVGHANLGDTEVSRPVRGGSMIWAAQPSPSGRLTSEIPLATAPEATNVLTAHAEQKTVFQDSILDVEVEFAHRTGDIADEIQLTGVGIPRLMNTQAKIPVGKNKGWISFAIPASLPPGPYTFAIQADTMLTMVSTLKGAKAAKTAVTVVSNPITIEVRPARITLEIDPKTPTKIARGKIIQLKFTAERKNGFIGKIHAELEAPGEVVGLRARGVTLVGQTESGSLQVIATETAPLGRHIFLRLEAVGTVEDQPVFRASRWVELEITE